ncbi:MAG: hypothetical protein K1060chlam5_01043 [Candidatus Anoxychlamydiales bacterium]|nr:hypothetical protein [Candidatus Anoxychlamydiales bacterium]
MTCESKLNTNEFLHKPAYYTANSENINHPKKDLLISRIFYATLPFIALHKPFGKAITLTIDSIKVFSSFNDLYNKNNIKNFSKSAFSICAIASTIFMHPMGILITTLYDMGLDINQLIAIFPNKNINEILPLLVSLNQHIFYIATICIGSIEIIAFSMLLHMSYEILKSKKEFQKGNLIEAFSHSLMSLVRFSQALPHIENITLNKNKKVHAKVKSLNKTINKVRDASSYYLYLTARFFMKAQWQLTNLNLKAISVYKDETSSSTKKLFSITNAIFSSTVLLPFAISGLIVAQITHFSAFLLATESYIHLKGDYKETKQKKNFTVFQNNACLTAGGFARIFGGTTLDDNERVKLLAKMIKDNDPSLVCMQEVSDIKDAMTLYNELKKDYSDFYLNIGATPFVLQNNSGLFIASKEKIKNPKFHSFSKIPNVESMVNKGFFSFTTKIGHFITTHLSPSKDDLNPNKSEIETRKLEQEKIFEEAMDRTSKDQKPSFVIGDFNINFDSNEYKQSLLFKKSLDAFNKDREIVTDEDATCETEFLNQRNWHYNKDFKPQRMILDYFLSFFVQDKKLNISTKKIATFDVDNPKEAITDHAALISEIIV